ncbi:RES domain-containing protein [Stenotrophomonas indicatrix]|uniref:RES domain-containing protein n=1 Tax=Stenotrophomonas indicatrix TaxID=2045451 RepID=UPI0007397907|nr:RES domain-containing protein [Stenotrophomonas indicatrix]CRD50907.1 conserved hypothetical protein [Stenotrophomonas indicatrix]
MVAPLPWFANNNAPKLFDAPVGIDLYRVVEQSPHWGPLDANPVSKARFALRDDRHGMFYVADHVAGALWEALLRYAEMTPGGAAYLPVDKLRGQHLVTVRLGRSDARVLQLYSPSTSRRFGDEAHPDVIRLQELLTTLHHADTHPEAAAMLAGLNALNPPIKHMPILQWKSKQFPDANVFLAFDPPLSSADWNLVEDVPLDNAAGHARIRTALAEQGFNWIPLASGGTDVAVLPAEDPD